MVPQVGRIHSRTASVSRVVRARRLWRAMAMVLEPGRARLPHYGSLAGAEEISMISSRQPELPWRLATAAATVHLYCL